MTRLDGVFRMVDEGIVVHGIPFLPWSRYLPFFSSRNSWRASRVKNETTNDAEFHSKLIMIGENFIFE